MSESTLIAEAFKGLVAAGPVATILGLFCYVLWKQNQELVAKLDGQHSKMLRLAVRVQRAVEVLAGIEHADTEVDRVLNEDDDRKRDEDEQRRKRENNI
jgi:hypothetical protein